MSIISPDLSGIVDGLAPHATAWTNPFNTIIADYNGGITTANISASAGITGTQLAAGTVAVSNIKAEDWTSWTPTLGVSAGSYNSTTIFRARYQQAGNTVKFEIYCTGTTTGTPTGITFTAPVNRTVTTADIPTGAGWAADSAIQPLGGHCRWNGTSTSVMTVGKGDGNNFATGAGAQAAITGQYEIN